MVIWLGLDIIKVKLLKTAQNRFKPDGQGQVQNKKHIVKPKTVLTTSYTKKWIYEPIPNCTKKKTYSLTKNCAYTLLYEKSAYRG